MKTFILLLLMAGHLMAVSVDDAAWLLDAQTNLNKAFKKAETAQKKLLLIVVIKDGCSWCEMMVHETLSDKNVRNRLSDMVILVTDIHSKTAKNLNTQLTPSMYFIDVAAKKVLHEHIGFEKPGSFIMDIVTAEDRVE